MTFVKWFKDVSMADEEVVGSNAMKLAMLSNARFPVPAGFIITTEAQNVFFKQIDGSIAKILKEINSNNQEQLKKGMQDVQQFIFKTPFPNDLQEVITDSYELLGVAHKTQAEAIMKGTEEMVTVRLSTSEEGSPPVFHVRGSQNVMKAIAACWAFLVTPNAISNTENTAAVTIQHMVNSEKAGIISTINPINRNDEMVILAAYGLSDGVTSGIAASDTYIVDKNTLNIKEAKVKEKEFKIFLEPKTGKLAKEKVSPGDKKLQALTDKEIYQVARYGKKVHEYFNAPHNIEWAIENDQVYILQCIAKKKEEQDEPEADQPTKETIEEKGREKATKVGVVIDLPQHAEEIAKQTNAECVIIKPE